MHLLGSFAHALTSRLRALFPTPNPIALNVDSGSVRLPKREHATMRTYNPVTRQWGNPAPVQIIHASAEEAAKGLARLHRYLPAWQAGPALYIEKPQTALLVSITACAYDSRAFRLEFNVDEVLRAPENFNPSEPLTITCLWNQPMLSYWESGINASWSYRILFGEHGAENVRAFCRLLHELGSRKRSSDSFLSSAEYVFNRGISPSFRATIVQEASQSE